MGILFLLQKLYFEKLFFFLSIFQSRRSPGTSNDRPTTEALSTLDAWRERARKRERERLKRSAHAERERERRGERGGTKIQGNRSI